MQPTALALETEATEVNVPIPQNPPEVPIHPGGPKPNGAESFDPEGDPQVATFAVQQALSRWQELSQHSEADVLTDMIALALEKSPTFKDMADGWMNGDTVGILNDLACLCAEAYLVGVVAQKTGMAPIIDCE